MKIQKAKSTLIIFFGLIFVSFAFFAVAQENFANSKNIFQDSDQDGLSDDEERTYGTDPYNPDTDGDGYSDWVEIQSGYDPLKPAPGDKIINSSDNSTKNYSNKSEDSNLTSEFSQKIIDLISKNQENNEDIDISDIDLMIDQTFSEKINFDDLPEIDKETIKIKKQKYSKLSDSEKNLREKNDALEYLTTIGYIVATNSPTSIETQDDIQKIFDNVLLGMNSFSVNPSSIPNYFIELSKKGDSMLEEMKNVEVPESLVDFHIKGLQLAKYSISLKDTTETQGDDPIAMIVSMSKVNNFLTLIESFANDINNKLTSLGIEIKS